MIVVTGAAGFIGSYFAGYMLREGFKDIVIVDDFSKDYKSLNHIDKKVTAKVERDDFFTWLDINQRFVQFVVHLGARTDTTEFNSSVFDTLNFNYSCKVWNKCCEYSIPLIYASSAATYGAGELGYSDDETKIPELRPLNPYGVSKNQFDIWALKQNDKPFFWTGLKFFNVYGPNEYHKSRMASVIFHSYNQICDSGRVKLFRSHRPDFKDGEQKRDFIYVADVAKVIMFFMQTRKSSGIYNLGTGKARTFNDLIQSVFNSLGKKNSTDYIDIPVDIRDKYQYFTEADMKKLRKAGYSSEFCSLEDGINDYVKNYLINRKIF